MKEAPGSVGLAKAAPSGGSALGIMERPSSPVSGISPPKGGGSIPFAELVDPSLGGISNGFGNLSRGDLLGLLSDPISQQPVKEGPAPVSLKAVLSTTLEVEMPQIKRTPNEQKESAKKKIVGKNSSSKFRFETKPYVIENKIVELPKPSTDHTVAPDQPEPEKKEEEIKPLIVIPVEFTKHKEEEKRSDSTESESEKVEKKTFVPQRHLPEKPEFAYHGGIPPIIIYQRPGYRPDDDSQSAQVAYNHTKPKVEQIATPVQSKEEKDQKNIKQSEPIEGVGGLIPFIRDEPTNTLRKEILSSAAEISLEKNGVINGYDMVNSVPQEATPELQSEIVRKTEMSDKAYPILLSYIRETKGIKSLKTAFQLIYQAIRNIPAVARGKGGEYVKPTDVDRVAGAKLVRPQIVKRFG